MVRPQLLAAAATAADSSPLRELGAERPSDGLSDADSQPGALGTLIFDLDGTLVDSAPGIAFSLVSAFRSIGSTLDERRVRAVIGPPAATMARCLDPTLSNDQISAIAAHFRSSYDTDGWHHTTIFPGVSESLHALRSRGAELYVATNKPVGPTGQILDLFALAPLFQGIVCRNSRQGGELYPNKAQMLGDLIEQHSIEAESACMVGDTEEDGAAAAANGLHFIQVSYGYGAAVAGAETIHAFQDLSALNIQRTTQPREI